MPFIISIDLGTTHCKAITVDAAGRQAGYFKLPVVSLQPQPGWHEQDAEAIFQSVMQLFQQSFKAIQYRGIACVSFSAAMHSLLAVDMEGKQLTNAITWADTRSRQYAQQLRTTSAGQKIYSQTGTPIHAMSPLCKLLWMQHEQTGIFEKAAKFISVKEYVFYRLFGKYIVDEGIASATGLYNVYDRCWNPDSLALAGIDASRLSLVVAATHTEAELLPQIQQQLQLPQPVSFVAGGNDGCLANLGCGALTADVAVLTTGTSGAIRVTIPKPQPCSGQGLFRYILCDDYYVTGGPVNNGGIVLEWFQRNFLPSVKDVSAMLDLAAQSEPGAKGLLFLPYLLGERAPVWDEDAAGVFSGIKIHHTTADFARAVVEGISFSLLQVLKSTTVNQTEPDMIYATGSITQSNWWMQLFADISGCSVTVNDHADASSMGAAFIGMYATGMITDISSARQFIRTGQVFHPHPQLNQIYNICYTQFLTLYPSYKNTFAGLTA